MAFQKARYDVAEFLLSKLPADERGTNYLNAKLVKMSGVWMNPTAVRILLRLGADVNWYYPSFGTPLQCACWQGDGNNGRDAAVVRETVQLLIDAGADVNLCGQGRGTPLHEAVAGDWDSPTSTRVLLENGATVDATDADGLTPLMMAARYGSLECARLLIAAGADPDRKDDSAKSAMSYALDQVDTWRAIVSNPDEYSSSIPEDKNVRDNRHLKALDEAEEIARLLGACGADVSI